MSEGAELKNASKVIAPHWKLGARLAVTTAASTQDLSLIGLAPGIAGYPVSDASTALTDLVAPTPSNALGAGQSGMLGRYMRFRASGTGLTIGLIFGAAVGEVSSANAPVLATTGLSNVTPGVCTEMVSGEWQDFWISTSTRWLGLVASGSGSVILWYSSFGGAGG